MGRYLTSRLIGMLTTIFLASIVSFAAIELPPGSYLSTYRAQLQQMDMTEEQVEGQLRYIEERFALSQPVYTRYFVWVGGLLRGDFGYSMALRAPVADCWRPLAMSLVLALAATLFTLVAGR